MTRDGCDLDANGREDDLVDTIIRVLPLPGTNHLTSLGIATIAEAVIAAGWVSPAAVAGRDAEKARVFDERSRQIADLQRAPAEARAVLGAVAALAAQHEDYCCSKGCTGRGLCIGGWQQGADKCAEECTCTSAPYLAVLAPVSGAVEGAGALRLTADPARVVPCPHDCGWVGSLGDFHDHRAECPVRANLPPTPVAGHEQEVRAEHEHTPGIWCDECPDADLKRIERILEDHREVEPRELVMSDCRCGWINPMNGTGFAHRKHVASVLAACSSGSSAPVQGDGA